MFEELTQKLESVFRRLRGEGKISEENVAESLREVRRSCSTPTSTTRSSAISSPGCRRRPSARRCSAA